MQIITLNDNWTFRKAGDADALPATVPGAVHLDLLANQQIEDPFYRDNEKLQFWIGETDWHYQCRFTVAQDVLDHDQCVLRFHGLDTLATIQLNGQPVGSADNMYRTWEFDVKSLLQAGENTLDVLFAAPIPFLEKTEGERGAMPTWSVGDHRRNAGSWLRKQPSNFGWDWGPMFVTSGIWRDVELVAFNQARLADVLIQQDHAADVTLTVNVAVEQHDSAALTTEITIELAGEQVAQTRVKPGEDASMLITDPQLWYPNDLGAQPLYEVIVRLLDANDQPLDCTRRRIGLRTLRLVREPDEWGESFQFEINGTPFFVKGANWIPADPFVAKLTRADYEPLIAASAAAHMNMLRVWGGGVYEHDSFYDLCDEYGICIWQDFMFACGTYPTFDAPFMDNVRAEAIDNVRRLRHHPSIALWCGNNELEQGLVGPEWTERTMSWDDYSKLFDDLLGDVIAEYDPQGTYWPSSPHSPCDDREFWQNPACGDTHLWGVWHGREPFEWYRECLHRFVSEFGLQSFPQPSALYPVLTEEDYDLHSAVLTYRQRSGIGNEVIGQYMAEWFHQPKDFESLLWMSQLLQGVAMKIGIEHWRRNMPRTMGTIYWQLNDIWQAPSWSSIDYHGGWKALHYMAKRFYAPILVSGVWDADAQQVALHITSDEPEPQTGDLHWRLLDMAGNALVAGTQAADIPALSNHTVTTLDITAHIATHGAEGCVLWLELYAGDRLHSQNIELLVRPKYLNLQPPQLTFELNWRDDQTAEITVTSQALALWVQLDTPGLIVNYSDNFFHLEPGQPATVTATIPASHKADFARLLRVSSLYDLYTAS